MATDPFETFDLSVLHTGSSSGPVLWLSALSRLGAVQAYPLPAGSVDLASLERDADWFRNAIERGLRRTEPARMTGERFRDLVFGIDEIGSLFRRTRGAAAASGRPLLVRLLAAPEQVAALPWELMLDPDADEPLVFAPDAHLVRTARDRRYPLRLEPVAVPLNVLLVLSNPTEATDADVPFDHYEEGRALLTELQDLIDAGMLVVDVEDRPSIENLRRRIGQRLRGYHVVHYLGHAGPNGFKLEDAYGIANWVSSTQFNSLLRACPDLRVTFFAGCRTAGLPPAEQPDGTFTASLSSADVCVRDACQTVIGMQAVLPFRVEQLVTRSFYQAICSGASVARALKLARAAVKDDEIAGSPLLNWAVPTLVTGHQPGPIIDPDAEAKPPVKRRRIQLKLDLAEPDREFFARFSQLRQVISVLTRRGPQRVVVVSGPAGAGKTRLLARALDEIDEHTTLLYTRAARLARGESPTEGLCELVTELLERAQRPAPARKEAWEPGEWWSRIIEELVDTPFVLAIDDLDELTHAEVDDLGKAVERLVQRLSMARIALAGPEELARRLLSAGLESLISPVKVMALTPDEVEQWVRRNRPSLAAALDAAADTERAEIHNVLGPSLHLWSQLERELNAQDGVPDLIEALHSVVTSIPTPQPAPEEEAASPAEHPARATDQEAAVEEPAPVGSTGPLRVMIAGRYSAGRQEQFAVAIATLALRYGTGARVALAGGTDARTAAAQLLPVESTFNQQGQGTIADVRRWLEKAQTQRPDIAVLDYGSHRPIPDLEELLTALSKTSLLIAAAGTMKKPVWPAWYLNVLAIGAIDDDGRPAEYCPYFAEDGKPDLYAPGTVTGTVLERLVSQPGMQGPPCAAYHTLAAAVLVWSIDRSMGPGDVANLLKQTAAVIPDTGGARRLDIDNALSQARLHAVAEGLNRGPIDEASLVAATGLAAGDVRKVVKQLVSEKRVSKAPSGKLIPDQNLADFI